MRPGEIKLLLPQIYQRTVDGCSGDVLAGLLSVMSALHAPVETVLERVPELFDPRCTDDNMVGFLAGWADLDRVVHVSGDGLLSLPAGLGWLRETVATSLELSRERGTKHGLVAFLESATGTSGFEVIDRSDPRGAELPPFHFVVVVPPAAAAQREIVEAIVETERPVHMTYELALPTEPAATTKPPAAPVLTSPAAPDGEN
jgi:hypothetical protein